MKETEKAKLTEVFQYCSLTSMMLCINIYVYSYSCKALHLSEVIIMINIFFCFNTRTILTEKYLEPGGHSSLLMKFLPTQHQILMTKSRWL